ncbi:MAG: cation transporter [Rhizobiales bacterium]|nr:cation transporter [Hyphomicrobiales bacterium]NRB14026.1 cation transporter [Hyphomicrobiales bacterium]
MSAKCGHDVVFDGQSQAYKRAIWAVILLNAGMFVVEIWGGQMAHSLALFADAMDFLADAATYGISILVIGMPLAIRAKTALAKGLSLSLMGLFVLASTIYNLFILQVPEYTTMGIIALMALAANLLSVLILYRFKDGDANIRSVWLCSRNDAIGNIMVMLAAGAVYYTSSALPDLLVAGLMSSLFLSSSYQIIRQARAELITGKAAGNSNRLQSD